MKQAGRASGHAKTVDDASTTIHDCLVLEISVMLDTSRDGTVVVAVAFVGLLPLVMDNWQ